MQRPIARVFHFDHAEQVSLLTYGFIRQVFTYYTFHRKAFDLGIESHQLFDFSY